MDVSQMADLFEQFQTDFLEFDDVQPKLSQRPDLHAFILLDKLLPGGDSDIVAASEYDEIYLDIDLTSLADVATPEIIKELVRCGVRIDLENDCLSMFA